MQHKITNEVFRELIKCVRSAYLSISKPEKVVSDKQIQIKHLKSEMSERVANSLKDNDCVIKTALEIEFSGKLNTIIDCLITTNGKTEMYCCFPVNYKISKYEIHQAAYQYYVAKMRNIKIDKIIAVRYKNSKDKEGKYSEDNFYYENITGSATNSKRQKIINDQISNLFNHIKLNSTPIFSPHHYCIKPFVCPLKKYCFEKGIGIEENIFDLVDTKFSLLLRLYWKKVIKIEDIEMKQVLPKRTELQIEVHRKQKEQLIKHGIYERYKHVTKYNDILALDIDYCETLIEEANASKAIIKLPFVFNLHFYKISIDSSSDYFEIINQRPSNETAKELVKKLIGYINTFDNLKILIYNKNKVFNPLFQLFNEDSYEYEQLLKISKRVFDLHEIFLNKEYCHPSFKGSIYLKEIAKITSPGIYSDNDIIKNGVQVENYYKQNTNNGITLNKGNIREIYKYLTRDLLAIINTNNFLMKKI